jgi:hypothetical protein
MFHQCGIMETKQVKQVNINRKLGIPDLCLTESIVSGEIDGCKEFYQMPSIHPLTCLGQKVPFRLLWTVACIEGTR